MEAHLIEWLDLILRWIHIVAGIMWIGNSFLFMRIDIRLSIPETPRANVEGELWMIHSGGYYHVEKKQFVPGQVPRSLFWFKWESYTTWISGFFLIGVVYYFTSRAPFVNQSLNLVGPELAVTICIGSLVVAYLLYDLIWRSPLQRAVWPAIVVSFGVLAGLSYVFTQILDARAAFIQIGAILGTIMSGNVLMTIIPSQKRVIAAANQGTHPDMALSFHAKQRSIHNSYITLPLLFIMLSSHFPSTFGYSYNWLVLCGFFLVGATVRHIMLKGGKKGWLLAPVVTIGLVTLWFITLPVPNRSFVLLADKVPFYEVRTIIHNRCTTCHSEFPSDSTIAAAPLGVRFDTPAEIILYVQRIMVRGISTTSMPPGNVTQMTDEERQKLQAWIEQGAIIGD